VDGRNKKRGSAGKVWSSDIIEGAKKRFLEEEKEDALRRLVLYGKIAGKVTRGRFAWPITVLD